MSVVESGAVDGIGLAENETMKMLITDHLDWQDEYKHLLILQEKINAYIGFCESAISRCICGHVNKKYNF